MLFVVPHLVYAIGYSILVVLGRDWVGRALGRRLGLRAEVGIAGLLVFVITGFLGWGERAGYWTGALRYAVDWVVFGWFLVRLWIPTVVWFGLSEWWFGPGRIAER